MLFNLTQRQGGFKKKPPVYELKK